MQIHFFAAARAASGVAETQVSLTDLVEPTLRALVEKLGEAFTGKTASGMTLAQVMHQCSFLIDGTRSELDTVPLLAGKLRLMGCRSLLAVTSCLPSGCAPRYPCCYHPGRSHLCAHTA